MDTLREPARLRSAVALVVITGVPVVWSFQLTLDSYNRPKFAFLIAGVATMAALSLVVTGKSSRAWRAGLVPALAIVLPLALSWLASPYKEWAVLGQYGRLQGLFPYVVIAGFGLLAMAALERNPREVAWAIAIAGGVAGSYSLLQAAGLDPFVYGSMHKHSSGLWTAQSTLGNINFAGAFFALAVPVALALTKEARRRDIAMVLLGLAVIGLGVSFSQGPWGAAVGGIAVTVGYWLRPRWRLAAIGGGLAAAAIAAIFVATVFAGGAAAEDPGATVTSFGARYWYWEAAVSIAADDPLTGQGPNGYSIEVLRHLDPQWVGRIQEVPDDPHSVPLAFLANAGVPGVLGYLLFVAWGLRLGIRTARRSGLGAGLLGAFVAYLLVSLVSLNELTINVVVWALFVALVGLDRGPYTTEPSVSARATRRRVPLLAAACLIFLGGWWVAVRMVQVDRQMLRGQIAALDNDPARAVATLRSGLGFWDEYHYRELAARRIGELGARRGPPEGEPYIDEMNRRYGYLGGFPSVRGLISYARLLNVWAVKTGTSEPAEDALVLFDRARLLNPYDPVLAAESAQVLAALGREDEAIALLETYSVRQPPVGVFWAVLATQYESAGRHSDAVTAVLEGLELSPESPALLRAAEAIGVSRPQ